MMPLLSLGQPYGWGHSVSQTHFLVVVILAHLSRQAHKVSL